MLSSPFTTVTICSRGIEPSIFETWTNLECDRASVFIFDEVKNELWTKAAKGTEIIIRVPAGVGIAGSVVYSKKIENIEDVYEDPRFNSAFDAKTRYRTRSMLACPVLDSDGRWIAVIQAINKFGGSFTPDD